ncbi:MAG TPA: GspH/FimT family pseudopilin [Gammaproteobacteria bacterium]|nr:GspH/FimT family pseudopilin [Gammaproteobacteria bacterium]
MRKHDGFTLIELLIVIAILSIFVTTAVPGFSRLAARENRVATVLSLAGALNYARARAISTGRYVEVCKSADGAQCSDDPATWGDGWIVFVNLDEDWRVDAGERILRAHGPVEEAVELTGNRDAFNFRPASINSTAGSLFVCAGGQAVGEAVIVSVTGRVRTSDEKADGSAVECS